MLNRLAKLREEREEGDRGFTLIELLVVVVIIGILIAIAIPLYLNYKKGANDKSAESDLRGAVAVMEQCQSDNGSYPTALGSTGGVPTGCSGGDVTSSSGTTFGYYANTGGTDFLITSTNSNGSGKKYCYASGTGGSVTDYATVPTAFAASCVTGS